MGFLPFFTWSVGFLDCYKYLSNLSLLRDTFSFDATCPKTAYSPFEPHLLCVRSFLCREVGRLGFDSGKFSTVCLPFHGAVA